MSIAMRVDNPAGSRELYERILDILDLDLPMGGILLVAGPAPECGWRVIEIWDSPEEAKRFLSGELKPRMHDRNLDRTLRAWSRFLVATRPPAARAENPCS